MDEGEQEATGRNMNVEEDQDETMRDTYDDDHDHNLDDEADDLGEDDDKEHTEADNSQHNEEIEDEEESEDDKDDAGDDVREKVENDDEGDEDEEDDDQKEQNREQTEDMTNVTVSLGGTVAKEALCLLDGLLESDKGVSDWERVTLLIKRLPATIGRSHVTSDKNFVGLGGGGSNNSSSPNGRNANKAVSRQHVRIDYRVPTSAGGCGHVQTKVGFRSEFFYNHTDDPIATSDIRILQQQSKTTGSTGTSGSVLPATGFFTLTCLGKNRVLVNGTRIEPNETVWIQSGTAIRIANYLLYFLTPSHTDGMGQKTLQIRDDVSPTDKKRKLSLGVSTARPAIIGSGTGEGIGAEGNDGDQLNTGSNRGSRSMQSEIESLSTNQLLLEMKAANDADIWDRRHQLIGSTLSYRAVVEATHDTEWYEREGGTVSRSAVMDWVAASEKFGGWVEQMLSKLEQKSYQASITKGMIKAGYIRTTSSGRYIKWIVPRPNDTKGKESMGQSDMNESNHTNVMDE
jgi:hypothetical protein